MLSHSPWLGYNMFVQKLDSALKASKLHHGVWNLSHPQGRKAFVEPDNEQMRNIKQEFKYTGRLKMYNSLATLDSWMLPA